MSKAPLRVGPLEITLPEWWIDAEVAELGRLTRLLSTAVPSFTFNLFVVSDRDGDDEAKLMLQRFADDQQGTTQWSTKEFGGTRFIAITIRNARALGIDDAIIEMYAAPLRGQLVAMQIMRLEHDDTTETRALCETLFADAVVAAQRAPSP